MKMMSVLINNTRRRILTIPRHNLTMQNSCTRDFSTLPPTNHVTYAGLIRHVATKNDLSLAKTKRILRSIFDYITESVIQRKNVYVAGFGKFVNFETKERYYFNPQTKEKILKKSTQNLKFYASKSVKETMSG